MNASEAVIVAHGSPAEPLVQDAAMAALAAEVESQLPGWRVRGATLASPGSLETALDGFSHPLVYPFFMAEGWFTGEVLPRRLARIPVAARQVPAFGSDPALAALAGEAALAGARASGLRPERSVLLLAAHGSQVSPASRNATLKLADALSWLLPFRAVTAGFIEEMPFLAEAARGLNEAICLPLFTLSAGHVLDDVPAALSKAGFAGPILAPIGAHPAVPGMVAAALQREGARQPA